MRVVVQALCIWVLGWGVLVVKAEDQNAKQSHAVREAIEAAGIQAQSFGATAIDVSVVSDEQLELLCDILGKQRHDGWTINLRASDICEPALEKSLKRVPNLTAVSFYKCLVPPFSMRFEWVDSVSFTCCKISGDLLASLSSLRRAKVLKFYGCRLTSQALSEMPQLRSVTHLVVRNLSGSELEGLFPKVPNLESLFLNECSLSDTSMPDLRGFKQLRHLNVSNNRISRLQHIPSTLEGITADDTILGDSGIEDLINATKGRLRALSLYGCDVTDAGLRRISQGLPNLWYLEIGGHKMTNEGIGQLKTLPKLESFSVPLEYPELEDGYETVMKAVRPRIRKKAAERRARQKGG